MTSTADLHRAVSTIWNDSSLNNEFKSYWDEAKRDTFTVLHDGQAGPSQPFPYCVFSQSPGQTETKMSGKTSARREIRRLVLDFTVHARRYSYSPAKSAKMIASELIEEMMKVFGGHPTVLPRNLPALTNGYILQVTYVNDQAIRVDGQDDEYTWKLQYTFQLDVPVAA